MRKIIAVVCPACRTELEIDDFGELFCPNPACSWVDENPFFDD